MVSHCVAAHVVCAVQIRSACVPAALVSHCVEEQTAWAWHVRSWCVPAENSFNPGQGVPRIIYMLARVLATLLHSLADANAAAYHHSINTFDPVRGRSSGSYPSAANGQTKVTKSKFGVDGFSKTDRVLCGLSHGADGTPREAERPADLDLRLAGEDEIPRMPINVSYPHVGFR